MTIGKLRIVLPLIVTTFLLTGCVSQQLTYDIDPEIHTIGNFAAPSSMLSISVIDKRNSSITEPAANKNIVTIRQENDAVMIKNKLIESFQHQNYKIISNPLLADVAIEFDLLELVITLDKSLLKTRIKVDSHLNLKITSDKKNINKAYKMSRSQEVANPVKSVEITGVVNELLSRQLQSIWLDPNLS